jgi:molybdate transport system substrate-binding protein
VSTIVGTRPVRSGRLLSIVVFAALIAIASVPAIGIAATVNVFAAASLKEALDAQARRFEADTGTKVVVVYGGSNALARQIEAGAPAELYVSADVDWMDYLERRGLLVAGSRASLLSNELVLIAPARTTARARIGRGFDLAGALGGGKLAMANPDSVPAGKYGRSALESLGVWASVERNVVRTDNVRAALALVARGEAALGIVYKTDAQADKGVRIVDTFPEATHAPIVYPVALVKPENVPAKALLEFLRSPKARPVWERYGFAVF